MLLYGLGVAAGQDQASTDPAFRTDGAEDIGRLGPLVLWCRGPAAPFRPAPGVLGLLTNPGFILTPKLYVRTGGEFCLDLCQIGGKVFLKASTANSF